MQAMTRLALAAALLPLLATGLAAQPASSTFLEPLVKLHDTAIVEAGPAVVRSLDQDVFVTADGGLSSFTVAADLLAGSGFATTIIRGTSSPAALDALRGALYQNRVRALHGDCSAQLLPLGSSFTFGVTWFGRGSHVGRFALTNEGPAGGPCSPREIGVHQAIQDFQSTVIADPGTEIVSSACTSDRQCPNGLLCCYPCGIPGCNNACGRPAENGSCPLIP